jgi:alpha-methylacyl-CoA racemase
MSVAMTEPPSDNGPLSGVRVLDLTRLLPGPLAARHMADFGACVIKVEDDGPGDSARTLGPMNGETSFLYEQVNRGKSLIRINLKTPQGRAAFLEEVKSADVVMEGFRPGVMERLGLSHDELVKANPAIVLTRISGYGQKGDMARYAGHDINFLALSGILDQTGVANGPPALSNLQMGDLLGGTLSALSATLMALFEAQRTGRGREVDVSMTDALMAHAVIPMTNVLAQGHVCPRGEDELTGARPCYGVYETADGHFMALGALEEKFWNAFCETVGRPDLISHHRDSGKAAHGLRAELRAIFRSRTQADWVMCFEGVDACVSPVLALEQGLENAWDRHSQTTSSGKPAARPVDWLPPLFR